MQAVVPQIVAILQCKPTPSPDPIGNRVYALVDPPGGGPTGSVTIVCRDRDTHCLTLLSLHQLRDIDTTKTIDAIKKAIKQTQRRFLNVEINMGVVSNQGHMYAEYMVHALKLALPEAKWPFGATTWLPVAGSGFVTRMRELGALPFRYGGCAEMCDTWMQEWGAKLELCEFLAANPNSYGGRGNTCIDPFLDCAIQFKRRLEPMFMMHK